MAQETIIEGESTQGQQQPEAPAAEGSTPEEVSSPQQEISAEELQKELETYQSQIQQIKKSQAGSDKLVTELRQQLEEERKKQMSDKERSEYEKQLFEQERLNLEREKKLLEAERLRSDYIANNQINPKFRPFLTGETEEEIQEQVNTLQSIIEESVKPVREELEKIKADAGRPGGGAASGPKNWTLASVGEVSQEYKRIEGEKGKAAADSWLNSIKG